MNILSRACGGLLALIVAAPLMAQLPVASLVDASASLSVVETRVRSNVRLGTATVNVAVRQNSALSATSDVVVVLNTPAGVGATGADGRLLEDERFYLVFEGVAPAAGAVTPSRSINFTGLARSSAVTYQVFTVAEADSSVFTLQLIHASDLEGGVDAVPRAPNFAAIVQALEAQGDSLGFNTVTISAGDNYIPGPFLGAAEDPAIRSTLDSVNEQIFGISGADFRENQGRVDITIMNIIGFDASALGNHEFDLGPDAFRAIIEEDITTPNNASGVADPSLTTLANVRWLGAQFPYLTSNLNFSAEASNLRNLVAPDSPILNVNAFKADVVDDAGNGIADDLNATRTLRKIAKAAIITVGGEQIGVVGATTPIVTTISSTGFVTSTPNTDDMVALAAVIQPVIDRLRTAGVNKIILATHLQQIRLEQQLVPLLDGVDISIAGGSDTLLADPDDVLNPGDVAAGPYPVLTHDKFGKPVAIVSTDGEYSYVGRLVVDFDAAGNLIPSSIEDARTGPIATTAANVAALWNGANAFTPGSKGALVKRLTDAVSGVVTTQDALIIGETSVFLEGRRNFIRTQETNYGNLTADANLWYAKFWDPTVTLSLKNGGGIRNPIGVIDAETYDLLPPEANPAAGKLAGQVSRLDLVNSLRFNNGLTIVTVSTADLLALLNHGVAASGPGQTQGRFPQVGGFAFSWDRTKPAGSRVVDVWLLNGPGGTAGTQLVDDGVVVLEQDHRMVTLNFLANPTNPANPAAGGGDGYPFPTLAANYVQLLTTPPAGALPNDFTFAVVGSEQDAFAEFFNDNYPVGSPYSISEEGATDVRNIQLVP